MTSRAEERLAMLSPVYALLDEATRFAVITHRDPDGDALGSSLACHHFLLTLGKQSVLLGGPLPRRYSFMHPYGEFLPALPAGYSPEVMVVVDASDLARLSPQLEMNQPGMRILNIDHHPDNAHFGAVNLVDSTAAAAGELMYDLIRHYPVDLSGTIGECIYTAILTDTGRFHFGNTTMHSFLIAAELLRAGVDLSGLTTRLYGRTSDDFLANLGIALTHRNTYQEGRLVVMSIPLSERQALGVDVNDVEGVVDYALYGENAEIGILARAIDANTTKVSLRSIGNNDVSTVAHRFAGGGHRNAAGCIFQKPLDVTVREVIAAIDETMARKGTL